MKSLTFLSGFLVFTLFFSCHKVNLCGLEQDIKLGPIEEVLDLNCTIGSTNNRVIRSAEAFQDLFGELSCQGEIPSIDFSQFTLLGQFGGATGCERYFSRRLLIDDGAQKYIYTVRVSECGGCEPFVTQWHWVLVPVLPEEYSVEFVFETA